MSDDPRQGWTSASAAEADSLCLGRHQAQLGLERPPDSPDSAFGIRVHAALAGTLPVEQLTSAEVEVYDACEQVTRKVLEQWFGDGRFKARCFKERRFWLSIGQYKHSGQADRVYRHENRALIIDYKAMWGAHAESSTNMQLRDLAVLVRQELLVPGEIGTVLAQPARTEDPEIAAYTPADLDRAQSELAGRVLAVHQPNPPRTAGHLQCAFCLAKRKCIVYAEWAGTKVPILAPVAVPPDQWTTDQCVYFCTHMSAAGKWLELCKQEMKRRLKVSPQSIPGFTLVPGKRRSTVNDPQALFTRFEKAGGTLEQFMTTLSVGKESLEKQVRTVTGLKGKALEAALTELLRGLLTETQDEPTIGKSK